ncbi:MULTISPECIES: hypothetical protein [unclassified Burkholderia]|nr:MULTISPECIES: hypothetical protein [unclassified Burkholderia]
MKIGIIGLGNVAELHGTALAEMDPQLFCGGWSRTYRKALQFVDRFQCAL